MTDVRAQARVATATASACSPDVQTFRSDPKFTSLGLPVAREYVILESEPLGDFVHVELEGHASSPGLGSREDALAEIMIEIAEDK